MLEPCRRWTWDVDSLANVGASSVPPCSGQRALSWEDLWALLADDEVRVAQLLGMPKVKVRPDFANRGFQRGVEVQQPWRRMDKDVDEAP